MLAEYGFRAESEEETR